MRNLVVLAIAAAVGLASGPRVGAEQGRGAAAGNPVLVLDTAKGVIEIELFPRDAPKTVAHITALVKRNFYRGFRFHRVVGTLAQIGDPLSRDMSRQAWWGRTDTGDPIGVAEFSKRLTHQRGTVGMAHSVNAAMARSQFYIMKQASPGLDGVHVIFGRVTSGMAVVDQLKVADVLKNATIKP
jgi:cyclophilin family peptidyl-prolyl cis-trans isomerase